MQRLRVPVLIYVDTYEGALAEAGDILQPMASGAITRAQMLR